MKAVLIDDEPIALEVLERMLLAYENIDILGSYTDSMKGLEHIKEQKPDIVFLDIEMGEINGLEFAEVIIREVSDIDIVFVTAYSQYALEAFEVNAIDYLLKPIQEKRLEKTLRRLNSGVKVSRGDKLSVSNFGIFEVEDVENCPINWRTQKTKELFAYLLTYEQKTAPKTLIIEDVFMDKNTSKASTILHTTVYQLRKTLEKLGYSNSLIYLNDNYKLDIPLDSDVHEFEAIIHSKDYSVKNVESILRLYKGDFLEREGYHWAMERQQRYKYAIIEYLEMFAKKELNKQKLSNTLKQALDKIYLMEPFSDDIAKMQIEYYGIQGKRGNLEIFFNEYSDRLRLEMNLKPMESTQRLYEKYI